MEIKHTERLKDWLLGNTWHSEDGIQTNHLELERLVELETLVRCCIMEKLKQEDNDNDRS